MTLIFDQGLESSLNKKYFQIVFGEIHYIYLFLKVSKLGYLCNKGYLADKVKS